MHGILELETTHDQYGSTIKLLSNARNTKWELNFGSQNNKP